MVVRLLLQFGSALPWVLAASVTQPPADALEDYRQWTLVTPEAVDMAPVLALSCRGPMGWERAPNPHRPRMFRVFVNKLGERAMTSGGKLPFPVGSMIVKEKFVRPKAENAWTSAKLPKGAKPELLTAMIKREPGFDRQNGDWQYVVMSGDAKSQTKKHLEHCTKCHLTRKSSDFVFGGYVQGSRAKR